MKDKKNMKRKLNKGSARKLRSKVFCACEPRTWLQTSTCVRLSSVVSGCTQVGACAVKQPERAAVCSVPEHCHAASSDRTIVAATVYFGSPPSSMTDDRAEHSDDREEERPFPVCARARPCINRVRARRPAFVIVVRLCRHQLTEA